MIVAFRRLLFLALFVATGQGTCAELRVLAGSAAQPVMAQVVPEFERTTGHRVAFVYGTVGEMARRVQQGEEADLVVVSGPQMDALATAHLVDPETLVDLGKTGVGLFVRKGATKPDLRTTASFRAAMLGAKTIGYNDPAAGAPVGIYLLALFERMGIAEVMARKTIVFKDRAERFGAVARGDVEIGFNQVSEILAVPSVDMAGPLPAEIQNYTVVSIAALVRAKEAAVSREFLRGLSAPASIARFRAGGFEAP